MSRGVGRAGGAAGRAAVKAVVAVLVLLALGAIGLGVWSYYHPLELLRRLSRAQLDRSGLERVEGTAEGRRLVLWRGGSGPDLVLLHGSGHHAGVWSGVVGEFLGDHTLHVPDLPGHGDSEPAEGPLAMAEVYGGLAAYLDGLEGRPILVGNSMGAWLATLYAHRRPERVERIVLVNGGALFNPPPEGLSLTPADREEARRTMAALRDPSRRPLPDNVLDDVVQEAGRGPIGRLLEDLPGLTAHLLDGRLGEVEAPVDLLWGESDRLMTLAYAERMAAELPRARLTRIERCGHIPPVECPEEFAAALRRVLEMAPPEAPPPVSAPPGEAAAGVDDPR